MKNTLTQSPEFWQPLLGKELYENLITDQKQPIIPNAITNQKETQSLLQTLNKQATAPLPQDFQFLDNEVFAPFYKRIIHAYLTLRPYPAIIGEILSNPLPMLKTALYSSIKDVPMRVCIYDLQLCRQDNQLQGENESAEYDFYCNARLSDGKYIYNLCAEYPEMLRLLYTRLQNTADFVTEISRHIHENKSEITASLCGGKPFAKITQMEITGSDCHNGSKKTVKCILDNGESIFYKPHCLKKEIEYQRLYAEFCGKASLDSKPCPVLDGGDYGIEKCLDTNGCREKAELERYFKRMGIHLFLCYLLSAGDMHQENIIASGEYPILVDAETIFGIQRPQKPQTAEDKINELLSWTVLKTGILPIPIWRVGDKGVIISALHSGGEAYSTVKLPIIKEAKTSKMYIAYDCVKIDAKSSLPTLNGNEINPADYTDKLKEGFTAAYRIYMEETQKFEQELLCFKALDTRYLIRHTQQYGMYLSSSTHPIFLKDTEARLLMLQVLQKNDYDGGMVNKELNAMLDMDTPLLTCKGGEYVPFYECSAYDTHLRLTKRMGEDDLKAQLKLITASMELLDFARLNNEYFTYSSFTSKPEKQSSENLNVAIKLLTAEIEERAVCHNGDISWSALKLEGENLWSFEPLGYNLYDGLFGMAVFLAKAEKQGFLKNREIYGLTLKALCQYAEGKAAEKEKNTGLYVGAGSLLYTFLILYEITGEDTMLDYAQKQVKLIEKLYPSDSGCDLISGNAGAIVALSKLYAVTGQEEVLALAEQIGDFLWAQAQKQYLGYGWRVKDTGCALSGMSHGNSGFIMAYAYLLEYTHDKKYCQIIDGLIAYENSMYCAEEGNWRDLRGNGRCHEVYANAWCHGAAGILLSRMKLLRLDEYKNDLRIKADIQNAAAVLFEKSARKGLCLCHGMSGNYLIMRLYAKQFQPTGAQRESMECIKDAIIDAVASKKLLAQDKYFTGLMTGLAGIALCLMEMAD